MTGSASFTISQAYNWACRQIEPVDARMLLQHVLRVNHAYLLTHAADHLSAEHVEKFTEFVSAREEGAPVAYLTGEREFYDLSFKVTPSVLIPRPETELLVEMALTIIPQSRHARILDLGTGSGAIGITIAKHRPSAQVMAIDLSADAIAVAAWNAKNLAINNIRLLQSNWFEQLPVSEPYDLIVSNPPYVASDDPHLQQGDLRFEPDIALSAHDNGLACIRQIIAAAPAYLVDGGHLLLEHGYDQSSQCRRLLEKHRFNAVQTHLDLAGIERVTGGCFAAKC